MINKTLNQAQQSLNPEVINEIYQEATGNGLITKETAKEIFNKHGLSLNQVAFQMSRLLEFGEETSKLKILNDLLKVHGAMEEPIESKSISINFSFSNSTTNNEKVQILIPR